MSRIRQLVRPHPQAPRRPGTIVLPLLALAAAGIAFYANARIANPPTGFVRTTSASVVAQPVALAQAAAPAARATPAPAARPVARISIGNRGNDDSYALVRKGEEGFAMSGSSDDVDQIRAAQGSIDGDFLWFRRDGKAWVVRDADTLARARQAWAPTEALNTQMQALNARMQPYNEKLEALGARMQTLGESAGHESPEMRAASEQMEALGEQMGALGERQAALGAQLASADDSRRPQLESEMEALGAQQQALGAQMERHSAAMETASRRMEQQHAPMEALGREMEAASRPMESIGKEMEKLGGQIEQQAKLADGQVRGLIDDAFERGLASPAPAQQ